MDTEKLKLGFELQRHEKPDIFDQQLREADFCHEKNGINYARFDKEYIKKLHNITEGAIKLFIKTMLDIYKNSFIVYLNEASVDYILEELDYYISTGSWKEVKK